MFEIPPKHGNEVCGECHDLTPEKYHGCIEPCSHLVSWASHKAQEEVVKASRNSVEFLKRKPEE